MEQATIRPSVTLYSLDRSLPNFVRLITSATHTNVQILVKFGLVENSPQIDEFIVKKLSSLQRLLRTSANSWA